MRKVLASVFVSLDGVMQAPGGPEEDPTGGFRYGGWVAPYWDETLGACMDELFSPPFELLLGRKTYDIFAAYWPYREPDPAGGDFDRLNSDIARKFNATTKYVATHSPDTLSWRNSKPLGSDVAAAVSDLKRQSGPDLLIQGSSVLVQTLLANDLIDEIRLLIFPIAFGKGKRLFGDGTMPAAFRLMKSATSSSGVLMANYERAGEIKTRSIGPDVPTEAEIERRRTLT
jgi:dihydrofolate reductase